MRKSPKAQAKKLTLWDVIAELDNMRDELIAKIDNMVLQIEKHCTELRDSRRKICKEFCELDDKKTVH